MREAARWLIDIDKPLWKIEDICREKIKNPPEEFIVLKIKGVSAAAMTLSFYDPFFWPNINKGNSGFIHKLSIKRAYAGKGYAQKLIDQAKIICIEKGVRFLRL